MDDYISALSISDLAPGTMKTVVVSGRSVALANVGGEVFAIDDTCTHKQCSLGTEGALDGTVVICGCHGAHFDVTTGKVLALPAPTDVASYTVKVENGQIFVKLT